MTGFVEGPASPTYAMNAVERLAFDRGMLQWCASLKRPDLSEEDRVRGALLAYQRQALAASLLLGAVPVGEAG